MHRAAPIDGGAEEDQVGPEHGLNDRQRDGGRLVNDKQLRLGQALVVLRQDVLDRLRAKTGSASVTSSSACARRSWCCGRMYCTVCAHAPKQAQPVQPLLMPSATMIGAAAQHGPASRNVVRDGSEMMGKVIK